ncbi:MAG: biotin--[acetyl-CoA-carboxylase] ligase [Phycisphaerales bacterium]
MHHAVIDSTNLEALRAWRRRQPSQVPQPLLVSADTQTAGRGRTDRPWQSPVGGLWMSVAWPLRVSSSSSSPLGGGRVGGRENSARLMPPASRDAAFEGSSLQLPPEEGEEIGRDIDFYQAVPLAVGLAVAKAVGRICRLDCAIKWPNDVLVNDRKLCGILCRYESPAACGLAPLPGVLIIGLGVNGNYPASALGDDLRHPATSLLDQTGRATDLALLRNAVAGQLASTLKAYDQSGLSPMLDELRARLAWRDQQIACDLPDGSTLAGRLMDMDAAGRLVLDDRGTARLLSVGDIRHLRNVSPITPSSRNPVYVSECSICRS